MGLLKTKRFYDLSFDELDKRSKHYKTLFYAYIVFALAIGGVNGYFSVTSIQGVLSSFNGLNLIVFLLLVLVSFNVLMLIFLWFIVESSYYKMLELFMDQMMYLKKKMEGEKE